MKLFNLYRVVLLHLQRNNFSCCEQKLKKHSILGMSISILLTVSWIVWVNEFIIKIWYAVIKETKNSAPSNMRCCGEAFFGKR